MMSAYYVPSTVLRASRLETHSTLTATSRTSLPLFIDEPSGSERLSDSLRSQNQQSSEQCWESTQAVQCDSPDSEPAFQTVLSVT